jgi:hypothetical protein
MKIEKQEMEPAVIGGAILGGKFVGKDNQELRH